MNNFVKYLEKVAVCPECETELDLLNVENEDSTHIMKTECGNCGTTWEFRLEIEEQ